MTKPDRLKQLENSASDQGIVVSTHLAVSSNEIEPAVNAALAIGAQILNLLTSSLLNIYCAWIIGRTTVSQCLATYQWPETAEEWGRTAYGPSFVTLYRQHALIAIKGPKGIKPADIPIEQPAKFEPVINRRAVAAFDLMIPKSLLARIDEVVG